MTKTLFLGLILSALTAAGLSGCDDPCVELSNNICRCERDEYDQRACMDRVDSIVADLQTTEAERDCCVRLLDQCTCDKLSAGEIEACGLAHETDQAPSPECLIPESLAAGSGS